MSTDETSTTTEGTLAEAGQAVKSNVVGSLKGIQEIETEAVSVIEQSAGGAINATRSVAVDSVSAIKEVSSVARPRLSPTLG